MSAAHSPAWLQTSGRHIVRADTGQRVVLRGVNRSGLEYTEPRGAGFLEAAGITREEMRHIVDGWGAEVVRVPFNQDWALHGRGTFSAEDYQRALDQVIEWAAALGAYTLLDLQWIDADRPRGTNSDGAVNRVPALPDAGSIEVWQTLAARYQDNPAVLYDIFDEPHDPRPDDSSPLEGTRDDGSVVVLEGRQVTMDIWQGWARHLVCAIRRQNPRALIFVSGVDWGYDLRGMPLTVEASSSEPLPNVVHSAHVYPWSGVGGSAVSPRRWPRWFGSDVVLSWEAAFGQLAGRAPVFVAEWGGEARHRRWGRRLVRYLDALEVGWTAWSWCDWPHLRTARESAEPSEFGALVREALGTRG